MAKKGTKKVNKKKVEDIDQTEVSEIIQESEEVSEIIQEEIIAEDKPEQKEEQIASEPLMMLEDAARRFAKGFRDFWIPGIKSYAKSQGFIEPATAEECKVILKKWGARF